MRVKTHVGEHSPYCPSCVDVVRFSKTLIVSGEHRCVAAICNGIAPSAFGIDAACSRNADTTSCGGSNRQQM